MKPTLLVLLLLSGCAVTENDYIGKPFVTSENSFQNLNQHEESLSNGRTAKIGFVEFDDLGFQKDRAAVSNVFNNLNDLNSVSNPDALLIVVFIHGWHHNADPNDTNVTAFKNFLINTQYEEDTQSFSSTKRQVVGIYIGWRGESNEGALSPLTYRSRKSAGLRVGQYGLQEVLAELSAIRKSNSKNRLVSIGHSFGGGVLYSSVMQKLVDSVVAAKTDNSDTLGTIDKAYGDLVILMNPALEAARVEVLNRRLSNVNFSSCQPLVIASFTSEYDKALSDAFPIGQKLFLYDDKKVALEGQYSHLVVMPYGNEVSYRTHELSCESCEFDPQPKYLTANQFRDAVSRWDDFRKNKNSDFVVGDLKLTHGEDSKIRPGTPMMNVAVKGDNLIKDHNAIWGGDFSFFARALIGMEFAKASECKRGINE